MVHTFAVVAAIVLSKEQDRGPLHKCGTGIDAIILILKGYLQYWWGSRHIKWFAAQHWGFSSVKANGAICEVWAVSFRDFYNNGESQYRTKPCFVLFCMFVFFFKRSPTPSPSLWGKERTRESMLDLECLMSFNMRFAWWIHYFIMKMCKCNFVGKTFNTVWWMAYQQFVTYKVVFLSLVLRLCSHEVWRCFSIGILCKCFL